MSTRPGFYVESRRFSLAHRAQAVARARHLASEYGREIHVLEVDYNNVTRVTHTEQTVYESFEDRLVASL